MREKKKLYLAKGMKAERGKWRRARQRYNQKKTQVTADAIISSIRAHTLRKIAKKRAESKRVKYYLMLKELKKKIESANKRASKYKMKYLRLKQKTNNDSKSPKSALESNEKISPNANNANGFLARLSLLIFTNHFRTSRVRRSRLSFQTT